MRKILTSFRGGEVSDRVAGRMDSSDYDQTCRTLENFILHPSGGADLRPGTYYCGAAKVNESPVRLIPFVRSKTEAYVLELSVNIIRVWKNGALVQSGGSNLEIATPWGMNDLFELKYAQTEEAIYFTHPDYQPGKLRYGAEDVWSFSDAGFSELFAVAHQGSPYTTIYSHSEDIQEKLPDPATLPPAVGYDCAFSSDGVYYAVVHATSPFVTIYKRSGDTFTKLADPGTLPTGIGYGCAFSPGGVYLAVAHGVTPFLTIYKRSGDTFTKLADPGTLPPAQGNGCAFSPDGVYLAVGHATTPFLTIYKRSGDTFTKLADPGTLPPNSGTKPRFAPDGKYLAVPHATSPNMTLYKRSGDTFTKLSDPATLPGGTGKECAFSPDGVYLAVATMSTPYFQVYKRSGDKFTKLADPGTLPTGSGYSCDVSLDNIYFAVGHDISPFVTIYKRSGDTFTKLADPGTLPTVIGCGCAFTPDGWTNVPWGSEYPTALTFHEQRLVLGRGRTIWASHVGSLQNFSQDPADTSYGYEYKFAADQLEDILWMLTKNHNIILGSQSGEWLMTGGDAPLTAANVYVDRVSAHGSANIAALLANESILFVQDGAQRLREFLYSNERGGYISPDLSRWAEHIGRKNFVELAWQRSPASLLWGIRENGELAALTLDRNYDIQAWHRQPTEGTVGSIAVIPGTAEDIIYMAVEYTIDGNIKKYIEYMKPFDWGDDDTDCFFVDCGKTIDLTYDYSTYITGATKAEPVVVTAPSHPFVNDDIIRIWDVVGMTELNDKAYMVKNKALNTFELYETDGTTPVDGTEYTTYVSGGIYAKATKTVTELTYLEGKEVAVCGDGKCVGIEIVIAGSVVDPPNPIKIECTDHCFDDGDKINIESDAPFTYWEEGVVYTVKNLSGDYFDLYKADGVTPEVGGGPDLEYGGACIKIFPDFGGPVLSGEITLHEYASKIHVGLPHTGKLKPQRLGHLLTTKVSETVLMLYKTKGGKIGSSTSLLNAIHYDDTSLFTGPKEMRVQGTFSREGDLMIVQDQPLPMTVLAIAADMNVGE